MLIFLKIIIVVSNLEHQRFAFDKLWTDQTNKNENKIIKNKTNIIISAQSLWFEMKKNLSREVLILKTFE